MKRLKLMARGIIEVWQRCPKCKEQSCYIGPRVLAANKSSGCTLLVQCAKCDWKKLFNELKICKHCGSWKLQTRDEKKWYCPRCKMLEISAKEKELTMNNASSLP